MSSTINQDSILSGKVSTQEVPLSGKVSTQEMLLSGTVSTLETLIGPPGPQGPKGDPGDSYTVKGLYATFSALQSAHPTGSEGDAWFVGTSENNVVYQWDVDQSAWVNVGTLKGPKGDTGENGVRGLGWYQQSVEASNPQIYMWTSWPLAPKWGEGDWLYDPDNGNVGICTSRTDNADTSGSASITYKGTLKGTDGITPYIGENGNWYIGDTDTGVSAGGIDLPTVTEADAGKYLHVNTSTKKLEWADVESGGGSELPAVTVDDAGKFLRVSSSGSWVAETVANANGGEF